MMLKYFLLVVISTSILGITGLAKADTAVVTGGVLRVLTSEENFGGCMIHMTQDPQDVLPACASNWVTLSCDGTHLSQNVSKRLFEQAQLAYALDKNLVVYVDDSRRINGYCLAYRVDLWTDR